MVEEMLAARGIAVSHETVWQWVLKFGQVGARPDQDLFIFNAITSPAISTGLPGPGLRGLGRHNRHQCRPSDHAGCPLARDNQVDGALRAEAQLVG
jgi:hypothetical protein